MARLPALSPLRTRRAPRLAGLAPLPRVRAPVPERAAGAMRALLRVLGLADAQDAVVPGFAPPSGPTTTTIGAGVSLKGELQGEGAVTILGQFEGDIVLNGALHVGPEAHVDANITARVIVIAGVVRGNLSADTSVEILPTGALTGTVKSGSFTAADGARVKGEIWVERPVEDRRLPAVRA